MQWPDIADQFYANLEQQLTERGKRRTPLSEAVSGNAGYLKNAFKTKSEIGLGRFLAIADALGVHPMTLLQGIVDPTPSDSATPKSRAETIRDLVADLAADANAQGRQVDAATLTSEALAILHTTEKTVKKSD